MKLIYSALTDPNRLYSLAQMVARSFSFLCMPCSSVIIMTQSSLYEDFYYIDSKRLIQCHI